MSDVRPDPDAFDEEGPTSITPVPAERAAADPLAFVLGGAPDRTTTADDVRSTLLEVHHTWRGTVLDTHHARSGTVTGGEVTGHRWRLLGRHVAWVPRPLALVLPFAPPMLSEVDTRPRADLPLSGPGVPTDGVLPIFEQRDGTWHALVQPGWTALIEDADGVTDLAGLAGTGRVLPTERGACIAIPAGGQVTLGIGEVQLHARLVPGARKAAAGSWLDRLDFVFLGLLMLTAMIGACFAVLVAALPGNPDADFVDLLDRAQVVIHPEAPPEEDPSVLTDPGASAERSQGAEGERGEEVARDEPGAGAQKDRLDQEIAENSGALGALREAGIASGFGGAISRDILDGIGHLRGKGVAQGSGLHLRGPGPGGDGTIEGIGGIGIGCPPGTRCKNGPGGGNGYGTWTKREPQIDLPSSEVLMIGGIDAAAVDAVIKKNLSKFRYCYQRQLQRHPDLSGKVVNRFVIAQDGTVSKAETKVSTVSPEVDSCISKTMARLQFPAPRGGGIAIVSYPFVFSAR